MPTNAKRDTSLGVGFIFTMLFHFYQSIWNLVEVTNYEGKASRWVKILIVKYVWCERS